MSIASLGLFTSLAIIACSIATAKTQREIEDTRLITALGMQKSQLKSADLEVSSLISKTSSLAIQKAIEAISENFLDRKFIDSPLGEGFGSILDPDPLYRTDYFDCTTLIETVVAIAISKDLEGFQQNIKNIRYKDGVIAYESRNHFIDLDWIPNNIRSGILDRDITDEIIKKFAEDKTGETSSAEISKLGWYLEKIETWKKNRHGEDQIFPQLTPLRLAKRVKKLQIIASNQSTSHSELRYIPISMLFKEKTLSQEEAARIDLEERQESAKIENSSTMTQDAKDKALDALALKCQNQRVAFEKSLASFIPSGSIITVRLPLLSYPIVVTLPSASMLVSGRFCPS